MVDSEANIDVVFRNGLKDFEVIPPSEIWDSIHPVISKKPVKLLLLSVAASVTVLLALSLFAYQWSNEVYSDIENSIIAFNVESVEPIIISDYSNDSQTYLKKNSVADNFDQLIVKDMTDNSVITSNSSFISASSVEVMVDKDIISFYANKYPDLQERVELTSMLDKASELNGIYQQYYPGNEEINYKERWSVTAMASPTYYSKFNTAKNELTSQLMSLEKSTVSYSGGVAFTYKLSKRFSIQSGLYYSSLGHQIEGVSSFGGFQPFATSKGDHNFELLTSNGSVHTTNPDVFISSSGPLERVMTAYNNDVFDPNKAELQYIDNTLQQNFSYLELPIVLRYKLIDKLIDLNLVGGVSYNLLVGNSVYTVNDGEKYPIGKTEGLNPITISSSIGMGMEYSFSENFSLNLEPTFRYYLNPFNDFISSGAHPYSFGIFSGISYKF